MKLFMAHDLARYKRASKTISKVINKVCFSMGICILLFFLALTSMDAHAATINFTGKLDVVMFNAGGGIYSSTPIGTDFTGLINDNTGNGSITDGITTTNFGCCIAAGGLSVSNNDVLDADTAALLNTLAGSNMFNAGDLVDGVNIEGDTTTSGGGRIEVGLSYILAANTFSNNSLDNYPFDPNAVLISLFFIYEENSVGGDVYSAVGKLEQAPPLISVPNVVGLTQSAAVSAIVTAGLSVGTITSQNSNTVPVGNVISQSPLAGSEVSAGSEIALVISLGVQPLANFSANPTSGNAPLSVNFVDDSTENITSWNWDFGDGTNSTSQYPSHNYSVPGTYTVSLTVSGPAGSDTETKVAYISVLSSTGYTYDASGIWDYAESNLQHNCPVTPYTLENGQVGLLQTGSAFILRADEYSTQGTASGATYNYSVKWCDFFDSVEVSFDSHASITLQSQTEGGGSVNFTATWPGGSCTGSHNLSISRPAPVTPVYDATGKWNYTLSDFSLNCGSPPLALGFVDVVQTGNKVSATDNLGNIYNGFVDGTQYALLRSYLEDGVRMTETILLDLSSANQGIGDAGFVWSTDCDVCWGNWHISISKAGSANIAPIISLLLDDPKGFTYAELSGNIFQLTDIEFPTCVEEVTFINNKQYIGPDGGTYDYTISNGCIDLGISSNSGLCVISRKGDEIIAEFSTNGGEFVDQTDQWGIDFSFLNNDATALKNWFVTNGFWPNSAILADGRVTNQDASSDGNWWIDQNVFYFAYPESDGCVDYKAYKLVNDRLMFATDAAHTQTYSIVNL